jgi:hypothetical protein
MALLTDDQDIREVHFFMEAGNNGDFYLNLIEYPNPKCKQSAKEMKAVNFRMAMSGGNASHHHEVRMAFVALYRAMEEAGLNLHPKQAKFNENQI